jgi:radical SAM superfamily enzyme YgiQ (UPF0313 family)
LVAGKNMKVTLVYPDFMKGGEGRYYEGIASLSAVLKQAGHSVRLLHMTKELSPLEFTEVFERSFSDTDLLGFSCTTNAFSFAVSYSQELKKKRNVLTVCGGVHATCAPEEAINFSGIDIICRGDGEYPLLELCDKLEKKASVNDIKNLWIKSDGGIVRNPLRPLLQCLTGRYLITTVL